MHIIEYLQYILLAIVQGIAEVLPISSSGHLQIFQYLFGMNISDLTLSIFLHLGSLIAVLIFYFKELREIAVDFCSYIFIKKTRDKSFKNFKLGTLLIVSTIPAALLGMLLKSAIESVFANIIFIGIGLIITATILYFSGKIKGSKSINEMTYKNAVIIGLFQAVGIVPGISRSGITISGAKNQKITNSDSAKYAFLMFIPITVGALFVELLDIKKGVSSFNYDLLIPYLIGIIISALTTYLSLKLLLKIISKGKLWYFSIYCLIAGTLTILISFIF